MLKNIKVNRTSTHIAYYQTNKDVNKNSVEIRNWNNRIFSTIGR